MQLNQKECNFVKELKEQEKLCIQKYQRAAAAGRRRSAADLYGDLRHDGFAR